MMVFIALVVYTNPVDVLLSSEPISAAGGLMGGTEVLGAQLWLGQGLQPHTSVQVHIHTGGSYSSAQG